MSALTTNMNEYDETSEVCEFMWTVTDVTE